MPNSHDRSSYTCYGFCAADASRPLTLGFTGHWLDAVTRWYHLGNGYRVYNPKLMRFYTTDNLSPFLSGGINTYSYCGGDPINNIDPSGHWPWPWRKVEPKYSLTKIKRTDADAVTKAYSGWYHHPGANGWDAEMAIKLPKRIEKMTHYSRQLELASNAESDVPEAYAAHKLKSVSKKIAQSRDRLSRLKRELPIHAREVAESMVGRPPDPPHYSEIGNDAVVPHDVAAAAANYYIRMALSLHDAPPVYRKGSQNSST